MSESKRVSGRHAPGTHEHSLCGMAFDAYESGDSEDPVLFAEPGQLVTCASCKDQLDHARKSFKGYRFIGD